MQKNLILFRFSCQCEIPKTLPTQPTRLGCLPGLGWKQLQHVSVQRLPTLVVSVRPFHLRVEVVFPTFNTDFSWQPEIIYSSTLRWEVFLRNFGRRSNMYNYNVNFFVSTKLNSTSSQIKHYQFLVGKSDRKQYREQGFKKPNKRTLSFEDVSIQILATSPLREIPQMVVIVRESPQNARKVPEL